MNYIKDILFDNILMSEVRGVVIHNDAGKMGASDYVEWLRKRDKTLGIAHWYIDRTTKAQVVETNVTAWHCGDGDYGPGNGYHIGYEVCQSMIATDEEFIQNEEAVFKQAADDMKQHGLTPSRSTVRLHKEFYNTTCPHRSWDLHGKSLTSVKDYFISRIKHYMDNPDSTDIPDTPVVSGPRSTDQDKINTDSPSISSSVSTTASSDLLHIWRFNDWAFEPDKEATAQAQSNTSVSEDISSSNNSSSNTSGDSSNSGVYTGQVGGVASKSMTVGMNSSNWNGYTDAGNPGVDVDNFPPGATAQCFDLANHYLANMGIGWDRTSVDAWLNANFVRQYRSQFERLGWKIIEYPTFSDLAIGAITYENKQNTSEDQDYGIHTEIIAGIEGNIISFYTQNPNSPAILSKDTGGSPIGIFGYPITMIAVPPEGLVK